ncbi:MAG: LysR family transcriptional regulator [Phycisphaera sp.]|nr:LysR family transcriptional regulator [Phycisphaera sp.]
MLFDAIRLFCDVAQHRSVSKGAEAHGVTQSAASQRIQVLEKQLGVRLIDRSKRPLQLTPAGELYHQGCRRILEEYERLKHQVTGAAEDTLRGEVTVAAIYSAGIDLLSQVKADFEATHPFATVSIKYEQPDGVYDRVSHEQCDLGILSYPERWRDLIATPLREEIMTVVVRAGHELAGRASIDASELTDHEMVGFDTTLPIARRIKAYLREHQSTPEIVNQFDNVDTIKSYVRETDAVAILPDRTVRREVSAGVLASIRLEPTLTRPLAVVYPRNREPGPLTKAFIEYLLKHRSLVGDAASKPSAPEAVKA